jgi:NAD(P)-dependent dehydrogenase (short-subunit alcohol dehydrogenase family)
LCAFVRLAHPYPLSSAGSATDPARVVNIGSIDGIRISDTPHYSYSASKAAVHMLTRVLASELAARHVTVNAIAAGPFATRMTKAVSLPCAILSELTVSRPWKVQRPKLWLQP